ncbi:MAG: elongation factor P [Coriobacteriales bacterium]|nr:elongation factor P [Coriobacteriales bacterium]
MVAISTADFKNGKALLIDGKPCVIIEFQHVKPGKGGAFVRTKIRDIRTGRVNDLTFRSGEKFDDIRLETKEMQFLYKDGDDFNFMDNEDYSQMSLPADTVGGAAQWLKENDIASLQYAGDELIGVEPPMFVELEVTDTEPGFKGDTVQGGTKPATMETGAVVQVPMFVNTGDVLKIDTRDGRYITRM